MNRKTIRNMIIIVTFGVLLWSFKGNTVLAMETEPVNMIREGTQAVESNSYSLAAVPTEESAYQAMIALKTSYPEGMRWTNENSYRWNGGIYSTGYGCAGFAFILSDAAFGSLPARMHEDYTGIRVGDILRMNGNSHSVIVLEVTDTQVVVAEGNYNSSIHWGRKISMATVRSTADYVMTRYPENTGTGVDEAARAKVKAFCERLYRNCLGREPEASGITYWCEKLLNKEVTGAEIGAGFVFGQEYSAKKTNDKQYVEMLYLVFMGRASDAAGKENWVELLSQGVSREYVYVGFMRSAEYAGICGQYGIEQGDYALTQPCDQNIGLTKFVNRLYLKALGRSGESYGINYWCGEILNGRKTAEQAAQGYILSDEFKGKNYSNEEYVKILYRTFMDRECDQSGLKYWVDLLNNGQTRETVLSGFSHSKEFLGICESYGVQAY